MADRDTAESYYDGSTPPQRRYQDIPTIPTLGEWEYVTRVKGALQEQEHGSMHNVALLTEAIFPDDRIKGVMTSRLSLLGLPIEFKMDEGVTNEKVVKAAQEDWPKMCPQADLRQLVRWGLWLGVGIAEKLWELDEKTGRWLPKLKVWHPRYITWRNDLRTFEVTTMDGPVPVYHGDPKWLMFTPYGFFRGWMDSLVRTLAIPWLIRRWAWRDWARHSEVYGQGIRKATVPAGADVGDKKRFLSDIAKLASEATILLPQRQDGTKFDLDILQAEASSESLFKELKAACDDAIAIAIVGQNLTTEVKGGSRAAATVHKDVKREILVDDAKALKEAARAGLLADWAAINFGDRSLAPAPEYQTSPPEDLLEEATHLKAVGDATKALRDGGINVDVEQLADDHNIPILPGPPPAPAAPSSGAAAGGGPGGSAVETLGQGSTPAGAIRGQTYIDGLVDTHRAAASAALRPTVERLLSIVAEAADYETMRKRVVEVYAHLDADALQAVVEKAAILSELAGRWAVVEDA